MVDLNFPPSLSSHTSFPCLRQAGNLLQTNFGNSNGHFYMYLHQPVTTTSLTGQVQILSEELTHYVWQLS